VKEATFSAVIVSNARLWLVIYLTGSNLKYFQWFPAVFGGIGKAVG
jgi:hypothetical protein